MVPEDHLTDKFSTKEKKHVPHESSNTKFGFFKNLKEKGSLHSSYLEYCRTIIVLD